MPVKNRFAELLPEITAWRRDFHQNPELDYNVHRTAGKVAELLRGFGVDDVTEGVGRSGVVGVVVVDQGKAPIAIALIQGEGAGVIGAHFQTQVDAIVGQGAGFDVLEQLLSEADTTGVLGYSEGIHACQ